MSIMRAWVSQNIGIDELRLVKIPKPERMTGFLLVKVQVAALNFSDILMAQDKYQVKPPRPFTPGQEIAGIVTETDHNSKFKIGDRVAGKVTWGGLADYALLRSDMAFQIPDNISFSSAASIPVVYTTSMVALSELVHLKPSDTVLVHAATGGVGLAAVQIAKSYGAQIIATASTKAKLDIAAEHGAHHLINYKDDDWHKQVKAITNSAGANYIVDPVGGDATLKSLRCIARDGTLLIIGFASGTIPQLPAHLLLLKRATAQGVYWNHDQDADMLRRVSDTLMSLLENNKIQPLYNNDYEMKDLPRALEDLQNRKTFGKLVVTINSI